MRLTPGWVDAVHSRLDARLVPHHSAPVALALSGGGDSLALLHLVADWADRRGRRVLALTVDHGLSPRSADWTAFAGQAAQSRGAEWRAVQWTGYKPATGLPAAARAARHSLLAAAARDAGARVILMAHTASDAAESDWMRNEGAPIGRLADWAPSPVWPEGRGLMLLRPLLDVVRANLRAFLTARGASWIEDPANADPRFHRARARKALGDARAAPSETPERGPPDLICDPVNGAISGPLESAWLAHAVACASGRARLPCTAAIEAARARLATGARQVALSGALLRAEGDRIVVARERGRRPAPNLPLKDGRPVIWDGRFEIMASAPGWSIGAAAGRMGQLSTADRAALNALPAVARPAHPVLFREGGTRPVLADPSIETRCLVPDRLRLASGGVRREDDLDTPPWRGLHHRPI